MDTRRTTPGLAFPFAVVGFAAGWLSDGFLANPLIGMIVHHNQASAGALGGAMGAALGAILSRHARNRDALGATRLAVRHLTVMVIFAGICTGGGVGLMETGSMWGFLSGALNGGLSAIAFIPVCVMVLAASRRAERARHGSIVAGADARAVWGILATGLAVMTLLGALEIPAAYGASTARPASPMGSILAVALGVILLGILVADAFALRRVGRIGRADLEARDPEEARYAAEVPATDLGLGDDVHAQMLRATSAYRSRGRAVGMLLGSVTEARRALLRALGRGVVGLAVLAAVLAGHRWAMTPEALAAYDTARCMQTSWSCHAAASLYEGQWGVSPDPAKAEELFLHGCDGGDKASCDAIYENRRGRGEEPSQARRGLPYWYTRP